MSDDRAERAFRDGLARHAERLEPAVLVPARPRRRTWVPLAAAAAAAVVVAAVTVAVVGPDDAPAPEAAPSGTTATSEPTTDPLLGEVRTVSFRDVAVDVPASWADDYAPTDQWCIDDDVPTTPYVAYETSMMGSTQVGCVDDELQRLPTGFPPVPSRLWAPHLSTHPVELAPGPDGTRAYRDWTLTSRTVGSVQVELLTDPATTPLVEAILATARLVEVDASGCETTSPVQTVEPVRPEPAFDLDEVDDVTEIAVCLYARTGTDTPGLLASRVLEGGDATRELAALRSAPAGGGPDHPENCSADYFGDAALVLRLRDGDQPRGDLHVYYDWCFGNGFDDGTTLRAITEAACAPLWGGRVQQYGGDGSTYRLCHPE